MKKNNTITDPWSKLHPMLYFQLINRPVEEAPYEVLINESEAMKHLLFISHALYLALPGPQFKIDPQEPFATQAVDEPDKVYCFRSQFFYELIKGFLGARHDFETRIVDCCSPDYSGESYIRFISKKDGSYVHARLHVGQMAEDFVFGVQECDANFVLDICKPIDPADPSAGVGAFKNFIVPRMFITG